MRIINEIPAVIPMIPTDLREYIKIVTTVELNAKEVFLITVALDGLVKLLNNKLDGFFDPVRECTICFTADGSLTLKVEKNSVGSNINLLILEVEKWRFENYTDWAVIAEFLEVLYEPLVNHKEINREYGRMLKENIPNYKHDIAEAISLTLLLNLDEREYLLEAMKTEEYVNWKEYHNF